MEFSFYHAGAIRLAERAAQTLKRVFQAWSPNQSVSFDAFLQKALLQHLNISKTWGETTVELLLGRKVRLPSVTDFDLSDPVLFKPTSRSSTVPVVSIVRKK